MSDKQFKEIVKHYKIELGILNKKVRIIKDKRTYKKTKQKYENAMDIDRKMGRQKKFQNVMILK